MALTENCGERVVLLMHQKLLPGKSKCATSYMQLQYGLGTALFLDTYRKVPLYIFLYVWNFQIPILIKPQRGREFHLSTSEVLTPQCDPVDLSEWKQCLQEVTRLGELQLYIVYSYNQHQHKPLVKNMNIQKCGERKSFDFVC